MKSSKESLAKRGYIQNEDLVKYEDYDFNQLKIVLNSDLATERSIAIRLIGQKYDINDKKIYELLINFLAIEKALYTKIEIQNTLELATNPDLVIFMIGFLGKIGNNQHKKLPKSISKKKSYPLARDIIARILAKMDSSIFPILISNISKVSEKQLAELIDAIGFMAFYNSELATLDNLKIIVSLIKEYSDNELIIWKIAICLSSFNLELAIDALNFIKDNYSSLIIQEEVNRSLNLINSYYLL